MYTLLIVYNKYKCRYTMVTVLFQYIFPLMLISIIYCKVYFFLKVTKNLKSNF